MKTNLKQNTRYIFSILIVSLLIMGFIQTPLVKVQTFSTDMQNWLDQKEDILVKYWLFTENKGAEEASFFYFEVASSNDHHNINVYRIKNPVPFNNENELLKKNGPLSESQKIGTVKVEKSTNRLSPIAFKIPDNPVSFEIINGVTAYYSDEGTHILWEQEKWKFEFIGSSSPLTLTYLEGLANEWSRSIIPNETGYVKIYEGNRIINYFIWEKEDLRYTFEMCGTNYHEIIPLLSQFSKIEDIY